MSLSEILDAREERWIRKCALSKDEKRCVVSLTLRMPVELRGTCDAQTLLTKGSKEVFSLLEDAFEGVSFKGQYASADGPYALFTVSGDEREIKKRLIEFEEKSRFGALIDADVMTQKCREISRLSLGAKARTCLVCGKTEARICAKAQNHTRKETVEAIERILKDRLKKGE